MSTILFLIWWMIGVLPFLIVLEGYHWIKEHMTKRGLEWTLLHYLVVILSVILAILWFRGYR